MDEISNEDLLILHQNGDAEASRILTFRLTPKIFTLAMRILGDQAEAEDTTQEALLRLWVRSETWEREGAKITTWLHLVVTNLCIDRLRKNKLVSLDVINEPVSTAPSALDTILSSHRELQLNSALRSLPDRQRIVVILRHIEGLSNPEIASILGISTMAVESLVARGLRGLKKKMNVQKSKLGFRDE